ncbi:uncharacterized protein LOC111621685 [Centruroides sculpturatus]|uniref:uncharacterized protein LOC111621685 n=1 Tax=Centruroides sculpturatus TaxID=218467 RepID=UPI000C6E872F|nr:uncharacterized protein LOC111621685 [Centruroides sculpturatus]
MVDEEKKPKFFGTFYGLFRLLEFISSIGGIITIRMSFNCGDYIKVQYYEYTCQVALIFLCTFFILLFSNIIEFFSRYFRISFLIFLFDLLFTVRYVISSIYIIFDIPECRRYKTTRITASVFGTLSYVCFFCVTSADLRWFSTKFRPY